MLNEYRAGGRIAVRGVTEAPSVREVRHTSPPAPDIRGREQGRGWAGSGGHYASLVIFLPTSGRRHERPT
jgi:hypothetical protein